MAIMAPMDESDDRPRAALIAVPDDLVDELVERNLVGELPVMRYSAVDAVLTVGSSALTVVTLLRDPLRIAAFARWLLANAAERRTTLTVTANGDGTRTVLQVVGETSAETITAFVTSAIREAGRRTVDDTATSTPDPVVEDATDDDVSTSVFVIHGRDDQLRDSMFDFLRALGLRPQEWEEAVNLSRSSAPVLGTVPPTAMTAAQATVVLISPDDVVYLHPALCRPGADDDEARPQLQARPNVLVELGMALAIHPTRTVIVLVGDTRPIADLGGLNYVRLDESPQALNKIANRLELAGCKISKTGNDWMSTRRFSGITSFSRQVSAARSGLTGSDRARRAIDGDNDDER